MKAIIDFINENESKSFKEIILDLLERYNKKDMSAENVISAIADACKADIESSKEPQFVKGETPVIYYHMPNRSIWKATYKYKGKNYKLEWFSDGNSISGGDLRWDKRDAGLYINGTQDDLNDKSMQFFIDTKGEVRDIKDAKLYPDNNVDMEKTVPALLKQWVYLQEL